MNTQGYALRVERLLDASPDAVFDAWTDPSQLAQWFHFNDDWKIVAAESDSRPGGQYRISWQAPDGGLCHELGEYREVVRPRKLVMTCRFDFPGLDEDETLLTVNFLDRGGKTLLVISQQGYRHVETRDNHQQGWPGFLDQLVSHLAKGPRAVSNARPG